MTNPLKSLQHLARKLIRYFKWVFNIPNYAIACDPATKEGDFTCTIIAKIYPRTGIINITTNYIKR